MYCEIVFWSSGLPLSSSWNSGPSCCKQTAEPACRQNIWVKLSKTNKPKPKAYVTCVWISYHHSPWLYDFQRVKNKCLPGTQLTPSRARTLLNKVKASMLYSNLTPRLSWDNWLCLSQAPLEHHLVLSKLLPKCNKFYSSGFTTAGFYHLPSF